MNRSIIAFALLASSVATGAAAESITEIIREKPEMAAFAGSLEAIDLADMLDGDGSYTVFVSSNAAFGKNPGKLEPTKPEDLRNTITYHIVPAGALVSGDLEDGQSLQTMNGQTLKVAIDGSTVTINDANVVEADIKASNGVVHLVDNLLRPTTTEPEPGTQKIGDLVRASERFRILSASVAIAGLYDTLQGDGPFTVFAPADEAYEKLTTTGLEPSDPAAVENIISYHVVPGRALTRSDLKNGMALGTVQGETVKVTIAGERVLINGAEVVLADVPAANGIVHGIDRLLAPAE